jgi:hypothetical protein
MKTGIDKLILTSPEYLVKEVNSAIFGIDTSTKQGATEGELPFLLHDGRGREVRAHRIYHNSKDGIGNYTIDSRGLLVQFNPSKIAHPYQLAEVGSTGYMEALAKVKAEMAEVGLITNLEEMKLSRVDVAKQAEMEHPCYQYEAAFKLMKGRRVKERAYEGGYLFANKSNQCMFYDKRAELTYQKMDAVLDGEQNFMRAEVRALKSKPVAAILGVNSLAQLNQLSSTEISGSYNKYITTRIFAQLKTGRQLSFNFNSEVEIMRQHYLQHFRGGWQKYLINEGIDITLMKVGGIDMFGKICSEAGYSRMQVDRIKAELQQMLLQKAQIDKLREVVTPATLIAELHEKFAA